jgi:fatty-acyl-CoA synthase
MLPGLMMDYPLTLDRIVEHAGKMFPRKWIKTKLPDGSFHQYSYADFHKRVKKLANVLVSLGVEPGDRVGTFAWNNYQHLEFYFGIPGAAAVCHTLNIRLFADQLAYIVNHAEDKVIFVDGTLLQLIEPIADQVPTVQHFVLFNAPKDVQTSLPNVLHYEDLMAEASDEFEWRCTDERMAMGLCYTSGTTGNPKGALYSHRSMFLHTLGENQASVLGLTEADTILPVVPQFHAMSWGTPFAAIYAGANIVMPGPHLQPEKLAEMIADEKVTVTAGVPSIWNGMYYDLKANPRDISSLRALVVGGSAMPQGLIELYETELKVNVVHAWGMTEMSPLGTISRLLSHHQGLSEAEQFKIKAKQGYSLPGVDMRIMNTETGEELPWDGEKMGELQVRGYWVVKQYFKRDVSPDHFTADGWFRTGDVATIDEDGYMMITDRTKDLVKSGGEWISTVDLENKLMSHPKVMEAAVIAIPDAKWAERPMAAIVPTPDGADVTDEELREFLAPHFVKFWIPEKFAVIKEVPKTSTGKFDKKVLRQQYADGEL